MLKIVVLILLQKIDSINIIWSDYMNTIIFYDTFSSMQVTYEKFFNNIIQSLITYIDLNRKLTMPANKKTIINLTKEIKILLDENYNLRRFLSYNHLKIKVNEIIYSKLDISYNSKKLVLERLGEGIKNIRTSNNLTMKQFSILTNVSVSFISKIENHHITEFPKHMFIEKIISTFNCDIEYVFGLIDSPKCCGEYCRPVKILTLGNYVYSFLFYPQHMHITEMLLSLYKNDDIENIRKVHNFLKKLTKNYK